MSKSWLEVLALSFLLSLAIVFTVIFNVAVLGGGKTTVYLNKYEEMIPELILLHFVVWPVISVGLYLWHRR